MFEHSTNMAHFLILFALFTPHTVKGLETCSVNLTLLVESPGQTWGQTYILPASYINDSTIDVNFHTEFLTINNGSHNFTDQLCSDPVDDDTPKILPIQGYCANYRPCKPSVTVRITDSNGITTLSLSDISLDENLCYGTMKGEHSKKGITITFHYNQLNMSDNLDIFGMKVRTDTCYKDAHVRNETAQKGNNSTDISQSNDGITPEATIGLGIGIPIVIVILTIVALVIWKRSTRRPPRLDESTNRDDTNTTGTRLMPNSVEDV